MAESDSGDACERYEFDAPSEVVDLKELENAEYDDKWFDQQAEGAEGPLKTPMRSDLPFRRSDMHTLPKAIVMPQVKTDVNSGPSTSASPPPNLVTSWGSTAPAQNGARPKRRTAAQSPAQPCRVSKRKGLTSGPAAPPSKKHKKSPVGRPAAKRSSVIRRNALQNSRTEARTRASAAAASATPHTEPSTSEEQELERIRNLQKEVALHRKKNEASYKAALAGNVPPKKMVLSATVPKEFHFNTNNRVKAAASSSTAHKEVDFITQLRKPSSPAKALKGATVPKPFNLSTSNKRKTEEPAAYVPMAQQIEQFEKRTPERYHLRSRRSQERGPSPVKGDRLKLTQAHTPHLMTHQRSRPPTVKSSAELEAEEVDRLHKFKFKAQELNRKILENVEGLKKPAVKGPTVPEGFELQIEKRLQGRQATKPQESEEKHAFKSHPLPKKILEGVVGLPEKKVLPPTVPESPAFILKKRVHVEPRVVEVKPPSPIKAPPVPHFGLPFQPRLAENHHVEVCPFSFEERERERRALKEKRLEEMRNEEVPQFKAQPLPDFDTVVLPEKKKLGPTKPEPFRLRLDERGAVKNARWEHTVKEEQKHQEEAAKFKARPNTVTHKEPFQPKKESRSAVEGIHSSTVVEAFELSTERRARERQEYERLASEKEALRSMMEEEQRREEEQRAKEEITRLRQEQVHKAQPIRHYKPVALKKSEVPLTIPHSPNFSDRFRL
ncbi:Targeting protein for Xklp2-B [Larimichthys crocea]|uniref:Targeting protein for Xklp2-B n=1 Tax=Larimichthys crocea TaxID=215358 RepID=A0A6G0ING9_LARCR|nr:Targeting protein for Xklp2-B [Larimichthys crocea]